PPPRSLVPRWGRGPLSPRSPTPCIPLPGRSFLAGKGTGSDVAAVAWTKWVMDRLPEQYSAIWKTAAGDSA
ncbi:MAG TPA: hypothetical protein VGS41_05035, partial [Chthonomonadales bacterium]|nr:hypothetical protein [Chthonomonadales bacterium]